MSFKAIVLVKQVPDTANISGQVMRPDGTVNRAKLPAVFNPEDDASLEVDLCNLDVDAIVGINQARHEPASEFETDTRCDDDPSRADGEVRSIDKGAAVEASCVGRCDRELEEDLT